MSLHVSAHTAPISGPQLSGLQGLKKLQKTEVTFARVGVPISFAGSVFFLLSVVQNKSKRDIEAPEKVLILN